MLEMRAYGSTRHLYTPPVPGQVEGPVFLDRSLVVPGRPHEYRDRLERESEHGEGNLAFRAGLVASQTQLGEALDFVRHNYRQVGYFMPDSLAPTASEAITALAKRHSRIIGTLSMWRDADAGLQADEIYREELDRLRDRGARLGELGRLAMDSRTPPMTLLLSLVDKVASAGSLQWHLSDFVVECNPRHVGFYTRMLGFSVIGGKRECHQVGAPAVLLHVTVRHLLHLAQHHGVVSRIRELKPGAPASGLPHGSRLDGMPMAA